MKFLATNEAILIYCNINISNEQYVLKSLLRVLVNNVKAQLLLTKSPINKSIRGNLEIS